MVDTYKEIEEEFRYVDFITGKKLCNPLSKRKLSATELDKLMNPLLYEY